MAQTNSETSFKAKEVIIKKTKQQVYEEYMLPKDWIYNNIKKDGRNITSTVNLQLQGAVDEAYEAGKKSKEAYESGNIQAWNKGCLAALDDCKTLLERVDRTEFYWSTELPKCFNDERISDLNKHRNAEIDFLFLAILAELEALKQTLGKFEQTKNGGKEVLSRNADDKK